MTNKWRIAVVLAAAWVGLGAGPSQPQLESIMREKLDRTEKILEAMVTSDWVGLETHSRELERLTNDPRWTVLKYPEYAKQTAGFVRAIQELHRVAAQRDLDKAPQAYAAVTLKCVECHRYMARERLAR